MAQLQSTGITGSLTVTGNITAQEFHTEYVSSSILHESGSTSFGNTSDDVHNFTGSLNVLGPISAVGAGISDFERVHINNLQAWSAQDLGSASSGSIAFRINGRAGATNDFIVHSNGTTNYTMQVVGNAETHGQLHINPFGGNIGIGTTSPTKTLDVDGTGIFRNTLTVHRAAGDKKLQFIDDRSGTDTYSIEHDTSQIYFYNETESEVVLAMKNSGDVYIPSGFLGIGTTTPSAPLQVHGEVYSQIKMYSDHTYSLNRNWRLMTNNFGSGNWGGFSIDQSSAQGGSTFTQRFGIAQNGNVGIGTDNPGQKLHIHNTATLTATYQKFTNGTATTGTTLGIDADGDFLINNGETKQIKLYTSDTQRLTILSGGNVGIGSTNPVNAKLVVSSGTSDGDNTVKIIHTRSDSNVPTRALQIDMDLSGADNTDADRTHYGLHVDLDSTADGDISNEHRIYGVAADVRFSGFSDIVRGAWFHAESNNITENTAQVVGAWGESVHDAGATAGGVTNMYGMYGLSSVQDQGTVGSSYGGFFNTNITSTRTVDTGVTKGVQGEVTIDANTANLSYGEMIAVMAVIDNNEGAVPDFGDQFLFKGDYQGTKGPDAWGLHVEGDKHYLGSRLFLGTTTADADSIMQVMGTDAERYVRFKTSNDESRFDFYIGGTGNASRLDMYTSDGTTKNVQIASGGNSYLNGGNVGIGTTSPILKLHIVGTNSLPATSGTAQNGGIRIENGANNGVLDIGASNATGAPGWIQSTDKADLSQTYNLLLNPNGGNVGIGTTNPSAKLDVRGSLYLEKVLADNTFITLANKNTAGDISTQKSYLDFTFVDSNANYTPQVRIGAQVGPNSDADAISKEGSGAFVVYTAPIGSDEVGSSTGLAERLRVDHQGHVGIGVTNPATTLEVDGAISSHTQDSGVYSIGVLEITAGGTPTQIKITTSIPYSGASASTHAHSVNIKGLQYGSAQTANIQIGWHVYNDSFYNRTATSSGAWAPDITLAVENNKVVIHLSDPGYWPKMYVESLYNAFGGASHAEGWSWADAAISADANTPNESVNYKANFGNDFVMATDGDVGIGTGSPGRKLHVNSGTPNVTARFESTDGTAAIEFKDPSGTAEIGNSGNSLILMPAGVTRMLINDTGNVGIGTTAPAGKLEISQQLSAASTIDYPVVITSRDDGNSLNQLGGEGVGIKFRIAGNAATTPGDSLVGASIAAIREEAGDTDSSTGLGFFISQNNETLDEAVRIDHNGSVGIGVTPFAHSLGTSVNLDLLGNGGIWGYAGATYVNSNAYYNSGWKYKSTNPAAVLQVGGSSQNLSFRQAASGTAGDPITFTQPFTINSSGYVGISTTNPAGSLHVYSGTSERLLVGGDVSIKGSTDLQIDGTSRRVSFNAGTGTVRTSTANSLYLATNSTTALTINSNQDATFAQDLTVNGEFTFNGGNVQGNVAYTVDMSNTSTFAENTYYPVTIPLQVGRETELRIEVPLNSGDDPSYATHSSGVSLYLKWSTIGNGWGTNYGHRTIYDWDERYTNVKLVGGITQMNNGSVEVVYLRGGMTYFFFANRAGLSITPRSSTYTNNSQSVSPTTSIVNNPLEQGIGDFAVQTLHAESVGVGTVSPASPIHGFKVNTTSRTTTTDILSLGSSHASVGYNGFGTAIVDYRRTYQESNPHVINRIKFIERGDSGNDWGGAIQFQTKALSSGTTGPVTRMSIEYNGNVGIGTDSPGRKLTITGDTSGDANNLLLANENDTNGDSASIGFSMLSNNTYVKSGIFFKRTTTQGRGDLIFANNNEVNGNNVSLSDAKMIIQPSGDVGIGTTSPRVKLHVKGANMTVGTIGTPKNDWYTTAYNSIQVGDGTTLWGRAGDSHFSGNYYVKNNSGAAQDTYINALSAHDLWLDNSSGSLKYRNAGLGGAGNAISWNTRFTVLSNGNFGIGTTSPGNLLDVAGDTDITGQLVVSHDVNYVAKFVNTATSMSNNNYALMVDSSAHTSNMSTAGAMSVDVNSGRAFTITGQGKVGIGTSSPSAKLHIHTDDDDAYAVRIEGSTNNEDGIWTGIGIGGETNNTKSAILFEDAGLSYSRGKLHLCVNNAADQTNATTADAKLTVSNDGNVGIGTTSPATSAKLTVMGNQTFGVPGNGTNSSARFISIEGNADGSGEGSSRIFFTEHNSTTAAMDKYGMSLGYRGGATSIVGASGNTWTGLSQIGNGQWGMWGHDNSAAGNLVMYGDRAGTYVVVDGTLRSTGDVVAYYSSDKNLKDNLVKINDPLLKINKLSGYSFNWNDKQDTYEVGSRDIGIVAQEVEKVLPEIVQTRKNGHKAVKYEKLVALLIEGMKEQQETIDKLEDRIKKLENR